MKTCRKCGALFDTRHCATCARVCKAKWKIAHPAEVKAGKAKWRAENAGKAKAATVKWQAKNRERLKAYSKKWRVENPLTVRVHHQNRRARKGGNGGTLSKGLAEKLFKLQKGRCPCCGRPLGDDYHLDHKMPIALGGPNEDWNMQLLRKRCNKLKHAKHPVEFMRSRGFLL